MTTCLKTFGPKVRLKEVFKCNNKPICVFDSEGGIIFKNDSYSSLFNGFDMFDHIMQVKREGSSGSGSSGSGLGPGGTSWKVKIMRDNASYDVNVTTDPSKGTHCVIVDDLNEYISHQTGLLEFHAYHTNFVKSLYPKHIVDAIFKKDLRDIARHHKNVTICFADIRGFTNTCSTLQPEDVMLFLNSLFGDFDMLLKKHGIFKLETVGDCYVTVAGLMGQNNDGDYVLEANDASVSAENMVAFAKDMISTAYGTRIPGTRKNVEMRVGVHTGDVTSGIIDCAMPKFSLFGDAMNMASRMETTGKPMHVHVSEATYSLLKNKQSFIRLSTNIKGKGEHTTYMLSCANRSIRHSLSMPSMTHVDRECGIIARPSSSNLTNLMRIVNMASPPACLAVYRKSFDTEMSQVSNAKPIMFL